MVVSLAKVRVEPLEVEVDEVVEVGELSKGGELGTLYSRPNGEGKALDGR